MKSKEYQEKKNSEYWEKRIANSTWKQYNSLEERNKKLLEFYIDASESIKDELYTLAEKYSKDGVLSRTEMHKQNRLQKLNQNFEKIIEDLGHKVETFAKENMQQGFESVNENISIEMGEIDFAMPNKNLMEKLFEEEWRGDSFSGRFWKNQRKLARGLNSILLIGLQQGKTATEMAIQLHNFMGKGFNECHRLVRTETMHYLNSATLQRYKNANVEYVQIWAAADERTCTTCGGYHTKTYPIEKAPILPLHANCRCTYLPVTDKEMISEYEENVSLEADVGKGITEIISGISKQKKVFKQNLKNVTDKDAKILLEQSLKRTTIKRAEGKNSKYSLSKKILYLAKNASVDTLAHELFHEIDITYGLVENGALDKEIQKDYRRLTGISQKHRKTIEDMLYLEYPNAFENGRRGIKLKNEYRGISDILNGMSKGEIRLGYRHEDSYWKKEKVLERETWAQYGRMIYQNDKEVMEMAETLFPETTKEVFRILKEMIK